MDGNYSILRNQLDELGYTQSFSMDSKSLVENLTADLLQTTKSLQHYMKLSKEALQQRDSLKCAAEPYKCDNAKLIRENNKLHLEFMHTKEDHALRMKEAKLEIQKLESELRHLHQENSHLKSRCREYELKNICADTVSSRSRSLVGQTSRSHFCQKQKPVNNYASSCTCTNKQCASCTDIENILDNISQDLQRHKDKNVNLSQDLIFLKSQLAERDKEISRLNNVLEGGRPFSTLSKDCCYQEYNQKFSALSEEIHELELNNADLTSRLHEALDKQHEAMARAVQLANKNSVLEKERDKFDKVALQMESECNMKLNEKSNLISGLRNQSESKCGKIKRLETELQFIMDTHQKCAANLEMNANEIRALKLALESVTQIKQNLFKENKELLDANRQLETIAKKLHKSETDLKLQLQESRRSSVNHTKKPNYIDDNVLFSDRDLLNNETLSKKELISLLEKERQFYATQINDIKKQLNDKNKIECKYVKDDSGDRFFYQKLKEERDFYMKENTKLKLSLPSEEFATELQNKICEMEHRINLLKKQNEALVDSNHNLNLRIEEGKLNQRKHAYSISRESDNYVETSLNKLESELKRAHADIRSLEEERILLRDRLKAATETRFDRQNDSTQRDSRYEQLLQETLNTARDQSSLYDNMQRECNNLREKLKVTEAELMHTKTLHNQLKTLQMQTDKNINDAQAQIYESKKEARELKDVVTNLERNKIDSDQENKNLRLERNSLRENLSRIDQDRDKLIMDIDEKTERISSLQHQLRGKDTALEMLENKTTELNRKLELLTGGNTSLEHKIRDSQIRNDALSMELANITKQRDGALIENRRLQSDLATMSNDLRSVNKEYENSRKEVEEMKQQLQHYVDEVRRIEEILSRKEAERTEMLDHFASLSHEATVLESNNHTLESEAASKNAQLQVTTGKLSELEMKLQSRESLVQMQEEKISNLIYNISKLESEIEKQKDIITLAEQNLIFSREMCATLENQKKNILIGVGETEMEKKNAELNLSRLTDEKNRLDDITAKDKATIESLELLLNESRREVVELKILLQDANEEARALKEKIELLRKRLEIAEGEGQSTRQRSEVAVKQLQELQWQINDERFQRARTNEGQIISHKFYPSGTL